MSDPVNQQQQQLQAQQSSSSVTGPLSNSVIGRSLVSSQDNNGNGNNHIDSPYMVPSDLATQVERLNLLKDQGVLTETEFSLAKQRVLAPPGSVSSHSSQHRRPHSPPKSSSSSSSSSSSGSSSGRGFFVPQRTSLWTTGGEEPALLPSSGNGSLQGGVIVTPAVSDDGLAALDEVVITATPEETPLQHGKHSQQLPPPPRHQHHHRDSKNKPNAGPSSSHHQLHYSSTKKLPYGTFLTPSGSAPSESQQQLHQQQHQKASAPKPLLPENHVTVTFFNSKGASGARYEEVALFPADTNVNLLQRDEDGKLVLPMEGGAASEAAAPVALAIPEYVGGGVAPTAAVVSSSSSSRSTSSSQIVLSYDWHWVDVVGRDTNASQYRKLCNYLTRKFNLCSSLLVDREHHLVLPQFAEAASNEHQHLVVLRVATPKINLTDDSVIELSNRWILIVDTHQKLIITLHRVDTPSMQHLRTHWSTLMAQTVAFEEFLLKVMDDAVATYSASIDMYEKILDMCESKLLSSNRKGIKKRIVKDSVLGLSERVQREQIMDHFENASSSRLLQSLFSEGSSSSSAPKEEVNAFLYHMHRRSNVQHRMLSITAPVLRKCFTEFRLCSKDRSSQMCAYCNDLSEKAGEVRDNAKALLELHISLVSFKTNELMALLTRVSIFFAPLSFLSGVYGMNFENMPELGFKFGYAYFWCLVAVVVVILRGTLLRRSWD
eukprot:PhM_4_TR4036/c0_g2_i1/m.103985